MAWHAPALVLSLISAAGDIGSTGDALWVPGAALVTAAGLIFKASTTYKEARQIDKEGAEKRETEAKAQLAEVRNDRDQIVEELRLRIGELTEQVNSLDGQVAQMRGDHHVAIRDMEERHQNEVSRVHRRLEREIRVAYRLRELMAKAGVPVPDELLEADHGLGEETS